MNFKMFKALYRMGYFNHTPIKTIGDLQKFIKKDGEENGNEIETIQD